MSVFGNWLSSLVRLILVVPGGAASGKSLSPTWSPARVGSGRAAFLLAWTDMDVVAIFAELFGLIWPAKYARVRRYERLGCVIALFVAAALALVFLIVSYR